MLFVHGATYPAHTAFDMQLDGMSWMDYIASRGYDVYLPRPARLRQVDAAEGDADTPRSQSADRARRDGGEGHRIRRRFHPQAPQHRASSICSAGRGARR